LENFQLNLNNYNEKVMDYLMPEKSLTQQLKKQIRCFKKSNKKLFKDNFLENARHIQYMKYRRFIKKAENKRPL